MRWIEIVEDMIAQVCRGSDADFLRLVGLRTSHLSWWRNNPDASPHIATIQKVEKGIGVRIDTDSKGVPVGWERRAERQFSSSELERQQVQEAVGTPRPVTLTVPRSAREEYEEVEFYGGKPEWMELPESERAVYENLFSLMESGIDEANAARDRKVQEVVAEFRNAVKRRILRALTG